MQNTKQNSGLTIIKASAGSGKTHRIILEYLKIIFTQPFTFKHILAVTFTNKATAEMKIRIIKELQKLAKEPDKSNMLEEISHDTGLHPNEIIRRANNLAASLLHEYSHFSVSTIDHFFQTTIRALTRELNLNGGYTIQINENEIIEEAVDEFLKTLQQQSSYMQVMMDFIDTQMENNKSWNVQKQLIAFTKELFREHVRYYYVKNKGSITGKTSSTEIIKKINNNINTFQTKATIWANSISTCLSNNNISQDDLIKKSKNPLLSAISNIENKKYANLPEKLSAIQEINNWGHPKSSIQGLVNSLTTFFAQKTEELKQLLNTEYQQYLEATALYKTIFQHSLANGLMEKVSEVLAKQNYFLLADAPVLLSLFTQNSDTPFIFEKTGRRYHNFMIDEFQDTSALQWENFKPLIQESLASGNIGNFIVGDVKQAIYRWRNGDWTLLHKKIAQQIQSTITVTLQNNWRSKENIVNFNNLFFSYITKHISQHLDEHYAYELTEIYRDVTQTVPEEINKERQGGYVHIQSIESTKVEEFHRNALETLKTQINVLKNKYNQNNICVLVRTNKELSEVASYLINETNFNIISNGSLSLGTSQLIQSLITAFRYLTDQQEIYYRTLKYLVTPIEIRKNLNPIFSNEVNINSLFTKPISYLTQLSVLDLIGELIEIFDLKKIYPNQDVFLGKFYNEIKKITFEKGSNLIAIINWWDSEGIKKSIEIPESNSNHIRIMTIHKSKGLQFDHVFIPFAQWYPNTQLDLLWLLGNTFTLNELHGGLFPVKISKPHTFNPNLNQFYTAESFAMLIDQINMLYVANTRAKKSLFLFYQNKTRNKNDVSAWIKQWINNFDTQAFANNITYPNDATICIGKIEKALQKKEQTPPSIKVNIHKSKQIGIKSNIANILKLKPQREKGSLYHKIFERILTPNDIKSVITEFVFNGLIEKTEATKIEKQITLWINSVASYNWFSKSCKILPETDILLPQKTIKRPDRVIFINNETIIIDYKFGQNQSDQHLKQVQEYCKLFNEMKYENTSGYVWYPFTNQINKAF